MKDLVVIGAGGFGRELLSYIEDDNPIFIFKGFLDDRYRFGSFASTGHMVIGSPLTYVPARNDVFFVALGSPRERYAFSENLRDAHKGDFPSVIHPTARVSAHANLGNQGCIIGPRVGISVGVEIGCFTFVKELTVVGHDARIGNWCQINAHCTIAGGVTIGHFSIIHPNSVICRGAVIGERVVVAPGSVVYGRIPDGVTVLGNPARRFVVDKASS